MTAINKKMAQNKFIFNTVKKIRNFCNERNTWIGVSYIKSKDNIVADTASRKLGDNLKWSLCDSVVKDLAGIFSVPEIVLFTSRIYFKRNMSHKLQTQTHLL